MRRYRKGERVFGGTCLESADLRGAELQDVCLSGSDLTGIDLTAADLSGANLSGARLVNANLREANLNCADLSHATLAGANFTRALLTNVDFSHAKFDLTNYDYDCDFAFGSEDSRPPPTGKTTADAARLGNNQLVCVDLSCFCSASTRHQEPSVVDYRSILLSAWAPGLREFLLDTGMPDVFVEYMISCAQALDPNKRFTLMLSTFISFGGPDERFAEKLNQALKEHGVHTFFFPLDATLGQRNASVMHRGINEHDRVVLICSEASLARTGVLNELVKVQDKEAIMGGETCLIPIRLDNYVLSREFIPNNPDLRDLIVNRVVGDFRGADKDDSKFRAALPRLVAALRKPMGISAHTGRTRGRRVW